MLGVVIVFGTVVYCCWWGCKKWRENRQAREKLERGLGGGAVGKPGEFGERGERICVKARDLMRSKQPRQVTQPQRDSLRSTPVVDRGTAYAPVSTGIDDGDVIERIYDVFSHNTGEEGESNVSEGEPESYDSPDGKGPIMEPRCMAQQAVMIVAKPN